MLVTQWNVYDTMMGKSAHRGDNSAFLASTWGTGRNEDASEFASVGACRPLLTGMVPESFPLGREVAVTSRDAEKEGIVLFEFVWGDEWDGFILTWGVHFGENIFGNGLFHSAGMLNLEEGRDRTVCVLLPNEHNVLVNVCRPTCSFNSLLLLFGHFLDMAIHGILEDQHQYMSINGSLLRGQSEWLEVTSRETYEDNCNLRCHDAGWMRDD